jgi:hypothetical protein
MPSANFFYPQAHSYDTTVSGAEPNYKGYSMNNKYDQFPALMYDGRGPFAAFQPEAAYNTHLKAESGFSSNHDYRQHLINNGNIIRRTNMHNSANDQGYFQKFYPEQRGDRQVMESTPYTYSSYNERPMHSASDLKQLYLSAEELNAQKAPVTHSQDQMFYQKLQ